MTQAQLDAMEKAAKKRIANWIARSAGQHLRAFHKFCESRRK